MSRADAPIAAGMARIAETGLLWSSAALPRRLGVGLTLLLCVWQEPLQALFVLTERALRMTVSPAPHLGLFSGIVVWFLLANFGLTGRGAPDLWRAGYRVHAAALALCGFFGILLWHYGADFSARWGALYLPVRLFNAALLATALVHAFWSGSPAEAAAEGA